MARVTMAPPSIEFLEELRERARRYGWRGDYTELFNFMRTLYAEAGIVMANAEANAELQAYELEEMMYPIDPDLTPLGWKRVVFAKDQPPYRPLISMVGETTCRPVMSLWRLTWRERLQILLTGRFWHKQLTFGDPLQPILMGVGRPDWNLIGDSDDVAL